VVSWEQLDATGQHPLHGEVRILDLQQDPRPFQPGGSRRAPPPAHSVKGGPVKASTSRA
jgi:hypothetical protein